MKVEITQKGIFAIVDDVSVEIKIGEVITLPKGTDEIPAYLHNKCRILAKKPAKADAVLSVNPASGK
jgi:hypothetical protein